MNEFKAYLTGKNLYNIFLHLVAIVLTFEVVILARQNKELKQGRTSAQQESLKVGDYFSLSGIVPLNSGARLDTTSARQLIFVFSTGCHFCRETLPLWKKIADEVKTGWRVAPIGICLDKQEATQSYVEEQKVAFPVFLRQTKTGC